jgi:hypothetical protein
MNIIYNFFASLNPFVMPAFNILCVVAFFLGLYFWDIRESKKCPKCGAGVLAKSKFCPKCGNKL